jgi:hypothetical protein
MANVKATDLIDFTRASKGHAMAKVSYGPELVSNGDFSDGSTGWGFAATSPATVTISGGKATIVSPSGESAYIVQSVLQTGKLYTISADVTIRSGAVKFQLGSGNSESYSITTSGTHSANLIAGGTDNSFFIARNGACDADIDNVSVKEVLFDQPDGTIQLFEHPNNIPRIEYDSDGNLLGLLIEESRTNTIQYSEDFENSYWGKGGGFSIYGNHGIAPDGTRTATLLTDINDEDSYIIEPNICSNGQTKSVWIRTVSGTATLNVLTHHDQLDGEVTVTEEWQRFERAVDISEPGGDDFFIFDTRSGTNTASDIYIWGAQLETGGFATSYIRSNSGSSTTRSADVASIDVDQFGYNQSEGTVVLEAKSSYLNGVGRTFVLSDGTTSNRIQSVAYFNSHLGIVSGGVTQANIDAGTFTQGAFSKFSGAYKQNDFAASIDAGSVVTDTAGNVPTGITGMNIGSAFGTGNFLNGHIKSINYYPKRLSNAKLQELSS